MSHSSPFQENAFSRPELSVIMVNWNTLELTDKAIASLYHFEKTVKFEIVLVDNSSLDDSVSHLSKKYPEIRIIANRINVGFARANNEGVAAAEGEFLLLFNSDAYLDREVLPVCMAQAQKNPCIVGCEIRNPDGSLQLSVDRFPSLLGYLCEIFSLQKEVRKKKLCRQSLLRNNVNAVDWMCGAFLLMRRNSYLKLGGLDENIFMYGEDTEFCWRAQKSGLPRYFLPRISVVHLGGGSVEHVSLRALVLTDAGRIKTFAIMRGAFQAFLLRCIFICRSLLRIVFYAVPSAFSRNKAWRQKWRNHFLEVWILCGVLNERNFI